MSSKVIESRKINALKALKATITTRAETTSCKNRKKCSAIIATLSTIKKPTNCYNKLRQQRKQQQQQQKQVGQKIFVTNSQTIFYKKIVSEHK